MYNNVYNPQSNIDRINSINNQIAELEMKRAQAYMPQPITQNFQIAGNNGVMRYANNIEEVQRDFVIVDTPYFSRDMSIVWVKNNKGDIKSYELNEIVQKDEKDMLIDALTQQIEDLKKEKKVDEQQYNKYVNDSIKNSKPSKGKSSSKFNEK